MILITGESDLKGTKWALEDVFTLQRMLTDEEFDAAQLSINTAYYTPTEIIDTLWDVAGRLGFNGGKILEGSAGIGNILASIPKSMNDASQITAVELDDITGGILEQLYPDAQVFIRGFQDVDIDNATVGGWTVTMLEGEAKEGDSFRFENLLITVLKAEEHRVERVGVEELPAENAEEKDDSAKI